MPASHTQLPLWPKMTCQPHWEASKCQSMEPPLCTRHWGWGTEERQLTDKSSALDPQEVFSSRTEMPARAASVKGSKNQPTLPFTDPLYSPPSTPQQLNPVNHFLPCKHKKRKRWRLGGKFLCSRGSGKRHSNLTTSKVRCYWRILSKRQNFTTITSL